VTGSRLPFGDPFKENETLNGHLKEMVEQLYRLGITLKETQTEIERLYILRILDSCDGNRSRAAKRLGMHRNTLNSKIDQYRLDGNRRS
jgi:DNA-binding NtrC family response regulator